MREKKSDLFLKAANSDIQSTAVLPFVANARVCFTAKSCK